MISKSEMVFRGPITPALQQAFSNTLRDLRREQDLARATFTHRDQLLAKLTFAPDFVTHDEWFGP